MFRKSHASGQDARSVRALINPCSLHVFSYWFVLCIMIVMMTNGMATAQDSERLCIANWQCSGNTYCAKADGDCFGYGVCTVKPGGCIDVWEPVCGCDGNTYSNSCFAASAGVNVAFPGECDAPCHSNEECVTGYYCATRDGDCEGEGTCQWIPDACLDVWDPVCGCDGNTYSNSCYAAMNSVSVAHNGVCNDHATSGGCQSNFECNWWTEFCQKDEGDCDGIGQCTTRPFYCLDVWIPVCGCNGQTYSNDCYAHRAGVNVAHQGGCNGEGGGPIILMGLGDDERVGTIHLLALLNHWGDCHSECPYDLTGDGMVGIDDLLVLLTHWDWHLK